MEEELLQLHISYHNDDGEEYVEVTRTVDGVSNYISLDIQELEYIQQIIRNNRLKIVKAFKDNE